MNFRFCFALSVACQFLLGIARADDALFSEIAMESVFASSTAGSIKIATQDGSTQFDRITGPNSLTVALKSAGFEPKQTDETVTITVDSGGWKLPVALTVDVLQDRITCRMSLVEVDKEASFSNSDVLALMSASDRIDDASFVFNREDNRVQLRTTLNNRDLTGNSLKNKLTSLADTAIVHSDTWLKLKSTTSSTTPSPSTSQVATSSSESSTVPSTSSVSVGGKWIATLSANASIAIELDSKGTFKMAHISGKQSAVSTGTLQRRADQLTLSEAGKADVKFQIESVTATEMKLRIVDSSGKSGRLIQFSKAKL